MHNRTGNNLQGSHSSWKVLDLSFLKFPDLENDFGPGKSLKFKLKMLQSPGISWDMDADCRCRRENIPIHTPLFSLHVTVINTAVWILLSLSYM